MDTPMGARQRMIRRRRPVWRPLRRLTQVRVSLPHRTSRRRPIGMHGTGLRRETDIIQDMQIVLVLHRRLTEVLILILLPAGPILPLARDGVDTFPGVHHYLRSAYLISILVDVFLRVHEHTKCYV
jgi:hypothetical protein